MGSLRKQVITEARTWVGTPFKHRGRTKGIGVDCIGLLYGVGVELNLFDIAKAESDATYKKYERFPVDNSMRNACDTYLIKISHSQLKPADIVLMTFNEGLPSHAALYTGKTLIHALSRRKLCAEHSLNRRWESMFAGFYRYPGLVNE